MASPYGAGHTWLKRYAAVAKALAALNDLADTMEIMTLLKRREQLPTDTSACEMEGDGKRRFGWAGDESVMKRPLARAS